MLSNKTYNLDQTRFLCVRLIFVQFWACSPPSIFLSFECLEEAQSCLVLKHWALIHSYGCMICQLVYETKKDGGNFTFRLLLSKRFKRSRAPNPILRKLFSGFEKMFCYLTLRGYWVNSIWDNMRNELAIILWDDFRPIQQQQLNAKRELFCIFPILQKSFPGIGRLSSTFWMIGVFFHCIITHPVQLERIWRYLRPKNHLKTNHHGSGLLDRTFCDIADLYHPVMHSMSCLLFWCLWCFWIFVFAFFIVVVIVFT